VIGSPGTDLIWAGGRLLDAWPASPDENQYTRVPDSKVPMLLIGGKLDFATPPQNARRELLPHLQNGHQVVLPGLGHTDDFWSYEPAASEHLINTYFDRGRVDTSRYTPARIDFTPSFSHGKIAKIVLAVMLSFAGLAALSLLWMPLRLRRGPYGRKAGAALRSVHPLVLGLGGWFVAVLIVLRAFPTVPLDDELLATLPVGIPIGLGIYLAWVNRSWSASTKGTGFAAAAGGALVGAWLGLNVTEGLVALVTTIAGAAAGANLTLLGLDIAWDFQARARFADRAPEAVATHPST